MRNKLSNAAIWMLVACLLGGAEIVASAQDVAAPEKDALTTFAETVAKQEGLPAEVKERVASILLQGELDRSGRAMALTEGLRVVSPEYDQAAASLGEENLEVAIPLLQKLSASSDPYLKAEATYFYAQSLLFGERSEEAIPLLKQVIEGAKGNTLRDGEALFLVGLGQLMQLDRAGAKETLSQFLQKYADGPERMRVMAQQQLAALARLKQGSLDDVQGRMDFSRRKLQLKDTGDDLRKEQAEIVAMLAKLIKEAEQAESQGKGSGSGKPGEKKGEGSEKEGEAEGSGEGQGQGGSTGGKSQGKDSNQVTRLQRGGPQSAWSQLRDRQRDPVFNAIKEKYPARYQQLIEQYYKSFENEAME